MGIEQISVKAPLIVVELFTIYVFHIYINYNSETVDFTAIMCYYGNDIEYVHIKGEI